MNMNGPAFVQRITPPVPLWANTGASHRQVGRDGLRPRIGWVTTWNCACGIATYSDHLVRGLPNQVVIFGAQNDALLAPDDYRVVRSWNKDTKQASLKALAADVEDMQIDVLIVQFNYGFFDFDKLREFLIGQEQRGVRVITVMHSTVDPVGNPGKRLAVLASGLARCARVLVHSANDVARLSAVGVTGNVELFPHGVIEGPPVAFVPPAGKMTFTIGTYGFCLPHKGLRALVAAFGILAKHDPALRLHLVNALYPAQVSRELGDEIRADIARLTFGDKVRFTDAFLPDEESLAHLVACDLIAFPYEQTGESASGAVRYGLASGRPVVTTDLPIFDDIKSAVFQVPSHEPRILANGLATLIDGLRAGSPQVMEKAAATEAWRAEHAYHALSARLLELSKQLVANR